MVNPIDLFKKWSISAQKANDFNPDGTTMSLATCGTNNNPSVRLVILKSYDTRGFIFYTNYNSKKAMDINHNPNVSCLLYYKNTGENGIQIRIEGKCEKLSQIENQNNFNTKSYMSKIVILAQSLVDEETPIDQKIDKLKKKYEKNDYIPCPDTWGGFLIIPNYIEFLENKDYGLNKKTIFTRQCNSKTNTNDSNTWEVIDDNSLNYK